METKTTEMEMPTLEAPDWSRMEQQAKNQVRDALLNLEVGREILRLCRTKITSMEGPKNTASKSNGKKLAIQSSEQQVPTDSQI